MALITKYKEGVVGLTYLYDINWHAGATIMALYREGKQLTQVTGEPVGRQFKHDTTERRIYLAADMPITYGIRTEPDPSTSTDIQIPVPERFTIMYKTD